MTEAKFNFNHVNMVANRRHLKPKVSNSKARNISSRRQPVEPPVGTGTLRWRRKSY